MTNKELIEHFNYLREDNRDTIKAMREDNRDFKLGMEKRFDRLTATIQISVALLILCMGALGVIIKF